MDRRKALKNMGLTFGYAVATPTLISILQSCKDKGPDWTPDFFTPEQGKGIRHLVDIILPKTDTPSASEVQIHMFIDKFLNEVSDPEEQNFVKMSMGKFFDKALADSGKDNIGDLEAEDLEPVLAAALKQTRETEAKMFEYINSFQESVEKGESAELDEETSRYAFANNLRGITIWGYKTSEQIGEQVLVYLPVPGEYIPCGDLNELTGGKAWSI
jgi:hypothetical protein